MKKLYFTAFATIELLYACSSSANSFRKYDIESGMIVYTIDTLKDRLTPQSISATWYFDHSISQIVLIFSDWGAKETISGLSLGENIKRIEKIDSIETIFYKDGSVSTKPRQIDILPEMFNPEINDLFCGFTLGGEELIEKIAGIKCHGRTRCSFESSLKKPPVIFSDHKIYYYSYRRIPFKAVYTYKAMKISFSVSEFLEL